MSRNQQLAKPPSLSQLFDAPEGFVGNFGWLCGYSADAAFLDNAVERFMRQSQPQRAHIGKIVLGVMLNPGNPQISPVDVPGVMHLPYIKSAHKPFRLLHSKVALLGFRSVGDPSQWLLRLIISTGNWTRATLEQNLDLAWHLDIDKQELKIDDDAIRQARADINAAWEMLKWLRNFFDTRLFSTIPPNRTDTETGNAYRWFEDLMDGIPNPRGGIPRIFDSRSASLLEQLPELVKTHCSPISRNYIGMGSGFFEAPKEGDKVPYVLNLTIKTLNDSGLLTQSPEVDVFVNPRGCQAVAKSFKAITMQGWSIREAYKPEFFGAGEIRSLHAKFILCANSRSKSTSCSSAWVYLGSGNLTSPGFAQKMSEESGNLESGVVLSPSELYWYPTSGVLPDKIVSNILPVQWDTELTDDGAVATGKQFEFPEDTFIAAPLAFVLWAVEGDRGILKMPVAVDMPFDLLDSSGIPCNRKGPMSFEWTGERPRQVQLRWVAVDGSESHAFIPVLDEFGRVAASKLMQIEIDDVWQQLESFPMAPDDEDLPQDDPSPPEPGDSPHNDFTYASRPAVYPIRRMMQLVENIAAKQTAISQADWVTWCIRMEQTLGQAVKSPVADTFRKLELNPLSPLWQASFRPTFAEIGDTAEGQFYEEALKRVEILWGMSGLKNIGEPK